MVVLFDAMPGEADLSGLAEHHRSAGLQLSFGLTRTPDQGFDLTVHPLASTMEDHRFGYRQPIASSSVIADHTIDVVLVPALEFDRTGARLGFGAGYYDRFLARLPDALKVGIADVVTDDLLPTEPFDISMTHLATVDGVDPVRSAGA